MLSYWLTTSLSADDYYGLLFGRGGERMFTKKNAPEETSEDLHADLDDARADYESAIASIQTRADDRRQVVRHRLASLESEDRDLDALQTALAG